MQLSLPWRFGRKKPFASIPRVNWDHPLAKALYSFALIGDNNYADTNLVFGWPEFIPQDPAFIWQGTPLGTGMFMNAGTVGNHPPRNWPLMTTSLPATGAGDFTVATIVIPASATPGRNILGQTTAGANPSCGLYWNDLGGSPFSCYAGSTAIQTGPVPVAKKAYSHMMTRRGTAFTLYVDGKPVGSAVSSDAVYSSAGTCRWWLGEFDGNGAGAGCVATVLCVGGWNRGLTQAEVVQWSSDPYCFLIYPEDEIFASLVGTTAAPTFTWFGMDEESVFAQRHWLREMIRHD